MGMDCVLKNLASHNRAAEPGQDPMGSHLSISPSSRLGCCYNFGSTLLG